MSVDKEGNIYEDQIDRVSTTIPHSMLSYLIDRSLSIPFDFLPILILAMLQRDPITLTWKDLSASVKGKNLISNCTGYCKPGEMLAIMGASGAGKTTLLSLLCQKADKQLSISGNVYANNHTFDSSSFYNFGVFVYQNDTLHEILTVRGKLFPMKKPWSLLRS